MYVLVLPHCKPWFSLHGKTFCVKEFENEIDFVFDIFMLFTVKFVGITIYIINGLFTHNVLNVKNKCPGFCRSTSTKKTLKQSQ